MFEQHGNIDDIVKEIIEMTNWLSAAIVRTSLIIGIIILLAAIVAIITN